MQVWVTNESHHFVQLPDIVPAGGAFAVSVGKDSIVTVSSWFNGQAKAVVSIPPDSPFPTNLQDNFDSYANDGLARFFADNGGSFQVAPSPIQGEQGMVLKQWVINENGVNRWGGELGTDTQLHSHTHTVLQTALHTVCTLCVHSCTAPVYIMYTLAC